MKKTDEKYMQLCLKLAKKGEGKVSPNPMVGCVVLNKDGKIISKGYHKKYGQNHAERDALSKINIGDAEGGTLYVNLEPCSHYGKTPPCTEIIIAHKIKRVVIGTKDINPMVNGLSELKKAGIKITTGVLENEAKFLNRQFIKNMTKHLPYVVLKTATTMDGKTAAKTGDSKWITSDESRQQVYKIRKNFDCIMTSSNTVLADNPKMEHRFKCILDKDSKITKEYQILNQGEIYLATSKNTPVKNGHLDLTEVLKFLYKNGICSVFVECGGTLAGAMLKQGLIDEIYQYIAPKITNDNLSLSCFNGNDITKIQESQKVQIYDIQKVGCDILLKSTVI